MDENVLNFRKNICVRTLHIIFSNESAIGFEYVALKRNGLLPDMLLLVTE
jgi:hypothetical protein